MKETPKAMASPLHRIKNLQQVEPGKVAEIEKRMQRTYVARSTDYMREARLRADRIRDKALY